MAGWHCKQDRLTKGYQSQDGEKCKKARCFALQGRQTVPLPFVEGSEFAAWAARIAYFEVLTHRKRKLRERLCFDDSLVHLLSREADADAGQIDVVLALLRRCMEKLSETDRQLVDMQYADDLRPREIARRVGRSPGAIAQAMHRIRMSLLTCIDKYDRSAEEEVR